MTIAVALEVPTTPGETGAFADVAALGYSRALALSGLADDGVTVFGSQDDGATSYELLFTVSALRRLLRGLRAVSER